MKLSQIMKFEILPDTGGPGFAAETEIADIDPCSIPCESDTLVIRDKNGNPAGTLAADTLRYLVRKNAENRLYFVIDCIEEGVIAVDTDGRIFFANQAYTDILGVPLHRIMGKYIQKIESGATLVRALETRQTVVNDKNYIKSIDKYVSVRIFPIFSGGDFKGAFSIFKDVTELNELSKKAARAADVAQEYARQIEVQTELKNLEIVGNDPAFIRVITQALTVAKTDATVLVRGENGTGKDLVAQLIHKGSGRKAMPFIAVNCAAIPENLIESELFGYEGGSFTGAKKGGQAGKFQLADGGTLFLDEIGDMPLLMQSKLLRVLQKGEIEKIGGGKTIAVDVRVIAATNQPLEKLIDAGRFRRDLFYRLDVVSFEIPPLRERPHDIVLLTDFFLSQYNKKYKKSVRISPDAYRALERYNWPGNVRELQHTVERTVILSGSPIAEEKDFSFRAASCTVAAQRPAAKETGFAALPEINAPLPDALKEYERALFCDALKKTGGDRRKAIELLGISRRTFYRKLGEHGLTDRVPCGTQ